MKVHNFGYTDDAAVIDGKNPEHQAHNECRQMDGVHYCVADDIKMGWEGASQADVPGTGLLFISRGGVGLSAALTVASLRSLAEAMTDIADKADATAARHARDALARAQGSRQ